MEQALAIVKNVLMSRRALRRANSACTQTIHRIYTERKNSRAILQLIGEQFESFTVHPTVGYFRGDKENSIAIEIVGASVSAITKLAVRIKQMNGQKSVLTIRFRAEVASIR
jgi:hypothetical protein